VVPNCELRLKTALRQKSEATAVAEAKCGSAQVTNLHLTYVLVLLPDVVSDYSQITGTFGYLSAPKQVSGMFDGPFFQPCLLNIDLLHVLSPLATRTR
jgi:hypothetical protein